MKKSEKCEVCNESIINVAGDVWSHGYGNMDKDHKPEPARSRLEPVEAPKGEPCLLCGGNGWLVNRSRSNGEIDGEKTCVRCNGRGCEPVEVPKESTYPKGAAWREPFEPVEAVITTPHRAGCVCDTCDALLDKEGEDEVSTPLPQPATGYSVEDLAEAERDNHTLEGENHRLRQERNEWRRKYMEMERFHSRGIDKNGEHIKRIQFLEREKDQIRTDRDHWKSAAEWAQRFIPAAPTGSGGNS